MPAPSLENVINVLLVDDEPALLDLTKTFLEQNEGIKATTAESGAAALELLDSGFYDVVVSDYQMPGMNGIMLLKAIRKRGFVIPFILFTGKGREEVVIDALNNGADFYLQKGGDPVSMYTMLDHSVRALVRERKAQEVLRLSELKFKKVFDVSFMAIVLTDEEGKVIEYNPRAEEMTGLPPEEVLGRYVWDIMTDLALPGEEAASEREAKRRRIEDALEKGIPLAEQGAVYEGRYRHRNGHTVHYSQQMFSIRTSKGFMLYSMTWETTKYRESEAMARESEGKYRTVFNGIEDIILLLTIDPEVPSKVNYIEINEAARRQLGYDLEDLKKMDILEVLDLGGREGMAVKWQKIREAGSLSFETMFSIKDGGTFPAEVNCHLISLGGTNAVMVFARDITLAKKQRDDIEKALTDLRVSEQRFRAFSENAFEGILFYAQDRIVDANPRFVQMFGYTDISELRGHDVVDTLIERSFHERVRSSIAGDIDLPLEFRGVKKDGSLFWGEILSRKMERQGRPLRLICARDITDQRSMAGEILAREAVISGIMRSSPVVLGVLIDRTFVWVNTAIKEVLGYSPEEVSGKSVRMLYGSDEEFRRVGLHYNEERWRNGRGETEAEMRSKDGRTVHVLATFTPLDPIDRSKGFAFTLMDITERRRAEEELRKSEEKFRTMFDSAADAIILHNPEGKIIAANQAAVDRFGYTREELMALSPWDMVDPNEAGSLSKQLSTLMMTGAVTFEAAAYTKDGRRTVSEVSTRVINLDGQATLLSILRDISERKQMEEGLKRAYDQINLLGQITRHDIKNQLMVAKGYLSLIESDCTDGAARTRLDKLMASFNNIERQIDFTRIYQDIGSAPPSWHRVLDMIAAAQSYGVSDLSVGKGIEGLEIFADPMVEKVFNNLVENSTRYGAKPPQVCIHARKDGEELVLVYEDSGPGIPWGEKELIFRKGFGRGTGLGLFLSRNILSLTGMTIREIGEPGTGVRFEISIPADRHRYVEA